MAVKIFIDAGHGGHDPGSVGNGLREKDITLSLAKLTHDILVSEYENVTVKLSREKDIFLDLAQRANLANQWGADYFVSIHVNAGGGTGFESFIHTSKSAGSVKAQNDVHDAIVNAIKPITDRGKKSANFAVLRQTKMPAILTEVLFIDRAEDAAKLKDSAFLRKVAEGHALGIAKAFNLRKKGDTKVDVNKVSSWAADAWKWAKGNRITDGTRPGEPITREQVVTMLYRYDKLTRGAK